MTPHRAPAWQSNSQWNMAWANQTKSTLKLGACCACCPGQTGCGAFHRLARALATQNSVSCTYKHDNNMHHVCSVTKCLGRRERRGCQAAIQLQRQPVGPLKLAGSNPKLSRAAMPRRPQHDASQQSGM